MSKQTSILDKMEKILCPTATGQPATEIKFRMQFELKIKDLWVGAQWRVWGNCVDIWICLIPCVPLHIQWQWHDPGQD